MYFVVITIANLIWILYSLTEGVKDGLFSHYKKSSRGKCDLESKTLFNIQRALVLLSTGGLIVWALGLISIPFIIGQLFMYKYFHKISYDITLKKIESKTEDAETTVIKKVKEKSIVMMGVIIQIFSYIFLI